MSNISHAADWISERRADNVALAPRISEDWLSLIIGLLVFALALVSLAGLDLLGWAVTTSVWIDPGPALGTVSKSYGSLGGAGALVATYLALLVVLGAAAARAEKRPEEIRPRLHRRVLDRLCELDRRQLRPFRGGDAGRPAEVRHRLVAQAHQRGRLHLRAARRARDRQFLSALRRVHQGSGPARTLHQDRHRHPRRRVRGDRGRQAQPRVVAAAARRRRDHRGLSDLLGGGLFRSPASGSASAANGRRRLPRASRSAASRRRSPPAARSARGRWCRCWCPRWS